MRKQEQTVAPDIGSVKEFVGGGERGQFPSCLVRCCRNEILRTLSGNAVKDFVRRLVLGNSSTIVFVVAWRQGAWVAWQRVDP
jgi:hypothetical protein